MKVLAFGTFDVFHPGHQFYLEQAAKYGNELYVVVALDETVKQVKGFYTQDSQDERLKKVQNCSIVTKAMLGNKNDKYAIIEEVRPDVLCIGYDQKAFVDKLASELQKRELMCSVIKITESLKPEIFKSSKLRNT
jgi:FAD synthetase